MTQSPPAGGPGNATVVVDVNGTGIRSTSATTLAIVTRDAQNPGNGNIERCFQTTSGQYGLDIRGADQRRVEVLYQQIATAAAGHLGFQITAYARATYRPNGYVAALESDLVHLILQ